MKLLPKRIKSKEVKSSIWYTICSVVQRGISILTLPLFTRLLTTSEFGQVSVYNSWINIFSIFITLNLSYSTFQIAMVKFKDERDEYIASLEGIFVFLALIFLVLYFPFQQVWNGFLEMPTIIVLFMVFEVIANASIQCWAGKKKFEYTYKSVVFLTLAETILSQIGALVLVYLSEQKGYAKIIGSATIIIIFGSIVFALAVKRGKKLFNIKYWKFALSFNIPLIPFYLSQIVFNQSDRLMINYYCGSDKAGIYSVAYTLGTLLNFVISAITASYLPWFYTKLNDGKELEDRKVAVGLSTILMVLLLVIVTGAPEAILIMAGKSYTEAMWIVPPVAVSTFLLFYSDLFDRILFFYERKRYLTYATLMSAVINVILNNFFIPRVGFIAAGYTTLVSYLILVAIDFYYCRKVAIKNGMDMEMYNMKALIALLLLFAIMSIGISLLYEQILLRYVFVVIIVLGLYFNGKKIKTLISSLGAP